MVATNICVAVSYLVPLFAPTRWKCVINLRTTHATSGIGRWPCSLAWTNSGTFSCFFAADDETDYVFVLILYIPPSSSSFLLSVALKLVAPGLSMRIWRRCLVMFLLPAKFSSAGWPGSLMIQHGHPLSRFGGFWNSTVFVLITLLWFLCNVCGSLFVVLSCHATLSSSFATMKWGVRVQSLSATWLCTRRCGHSLSMRSLRES